MSVREDIEVTPEMIEAGAVELSRFNSDFECLEEAAARIYRAMAGAARPSEYAKTHIDNPNSKCY